MADAQIQEVCNSLYSRKYSTSTIPIITDGIKENIVNFKKIERYFSFLQMQLLNSIVHRYRQKRSGFIVLGPYFREKMR